jgi:PII-like signaling protein
MTPRKEAVLVRAFVSESDRHEGRPLHKVIVEAALKAGLAGATVLHGPVGYRHGIHTELEVDAAGKLPMVIEIVDAEAAVHAFLPTLDRLIGSGLVTLENLRMMRCGRQTLPGKADP